MNQPDQPGRDDATTAPSSLRSSRLLPTGTFWRSGSLFFEKYFHRILKLGTTPQDTDEETTRRGLLSLAAFFGFFVGVILGIHDIACQLPTWGIPPLAFSLLTLAALLHFRATRNFRVFRFVMLLLMLLLPLLAQVLQGGFARGGASLVWALSCPICAVLAHGPQRAVRWFIAFLITVGTAAVVDPWIKANVLPNQPPCPSWYFSAHLAGISIVIFILVQYFVFRLIQEQQRSDKLLLNILPGPIANRIKQGEETIAEGFSQVTILFSDLASFTRMSAQSSPAQIVRILNQVFSTFDELTEKHGVEKIKTIGDAYMVVGGLINSGGNPARAIAEMALDMREALQRINTEQDLDLHIRVGINSGPVVAGVIGIRKFIYDLWGDAVNVASRMESTGVIDAIQVSESSYSLLKDDFVFAPRGTVDVKGKGPMNTWFLTGRRPCSSGNAATGHPTL